MDKLFAIFDMDGTLLDSMPTWRQLGKTYLISKGITPPENLRSIIKTLTLKESAEFFVTLGINQSAEEILAEVEEYMHEQYRSVFVPHKGAIEYLEALKKKGVRCCIATATDENMARVCLERLGMIDYFEFIISCETVGISKKQPDVYNIAAERLGANPNECAVFEDVLYAATTAKNAGYYLVAVCDPSNQKEQQALCQIAHSYICDYTIAAKEIELIPAKQRFTQRLHNAVEEIWESYHSHPFVSQMGEGSLDIEKFKYYMVQDYLYLFEYAKLFALGVTKANKPALMSHFAKSVNSILNGEMAIHKGYMARLGIDVAMAQKEKPALSNTAYTSYMLSVANSGGAAEVMAAVLACSWSYAEIGNRLNAVKGAAEHNFYGEWIKGYSSEDYNKMNDELVLLMNQLAEDLPAAQLDYLEEIFVNCSHFEKMFWDMAWSMGKGEC